MLLYFTQAAPWSACPDISLGIPFHNISDLAIHWNWRRIWCKALLVDGWLASYREAHCFLLYDQIVGSAELAILLTVEQHDSISLLAFERDVHLDYRHFNLHVLVVYRNLS